MASNRKLPFGYQMEHGELKEHPVEAEAVRDIFRRYLAGTSFAALAEHLRDGGPAYDGDKPWNKNMVARILENAKYTGNSGFPALVPVENFQKAQAQRKTKIAPSSRTPAQKELRRLCGGNPPKYIEKQVLGILNRLTADPEIIQSPDTSSTETAEVNELHRKLTEMLSIAPVDEDAARGTAMALAAERLNAIGPEEYETERLRRLFSKSDSQSELDAGLLHTTIRRITIQSHQAIAELKNGQIIEGGTQK